MLLILLSAARPLFGNDGSVPSKDENNTVKLRSISGDHQLDANHSVSLLSGEMNEGTVLEVAIQKPEGPVITPEEISLNVFDSRDNRVPIDDRYHMHDVKGLGEAGNSLGMTAVAIYFVHLKKGQKLASAEFIWHGKKHAFPLAP